MNRRGFLGAMLGAMAAPAIVKAENLMKIVVPPERKIITGRGMTSSIQMLDESPFVGYIDEVRITASQERYEAMLRANKRINRNGVYGARMSRRQRVERMLAEFDPKAPRPKLDLSRGGPPGPSPIDWNNIPSVPQRFPFKPHQHDPYWGDVKLLLQA